MRQRSGFREITELCHWGPTRRPGRWIASPFQDRVSRGAIHRTTSSPQASLIFLFSTTRRQRLERPPFSAPVRHPVDHRHESARTEPLARGHRGSHPGGCDLRPTASQQPPPYAKRALTAKGGKARELNRLPSVAALRSRWPIGAFTIE